MKYTNNSIDLGGLSGWRTLEIAKMKHPDETKFYLLSVTLLEIEGLNAYEDNPVTGHWTINTGENKMLMEEWAMTREPLKAKKIEPHRLTKAVQKAIITSVDRSGRALPGLSK